MSKQAVVDLRGVQFPDTPTGNDLRTGFRVPFQPTHPLTYQEQAEIAREHARMVEATRYDWVAPVLCIVVVIICLLLSIKVAKRIFSSVKSPARSTLVYSLYLLIRGARKVSGVPSTLWSEAKAADKKATEAERTRPE